MGLLTIRHDPYELDRWIEDVGQKKAKSVAAQVLTSLARKVRTAGLANLKGTTGLSSTQLAKRIRVFRANPKVEARFMAAGIIVSEYKIREVLLNPKQSGHPGRPRKSRSKDAKRLRAYRQAKGARPPRKGGVKTTGRNLPGRWIGTAGKGGRGHVNVLEERDSGAVARVFRDFSPAIRYFSRATDVATKEWPREYAAALQRALNRRRGRK